MVSVVGRLGAMGRIHDGRLGEGFLPLNLQAFEAFAVFWLKARLSLT